MDEPFFHAINPADDLFCHNILIGQGRIVAVSFARHGRPDWNGIISPYEAFTRERPKENAFEAVRSRDFDDRPTRLGSIFLFPDRATAEVASAEWFGAQRVLLEARTTEVLAMGVFDSRQLDATEEALAGFCKSLLVRRAHVRPTT